MNSDSTALNIAESCGKVTARLVESVSRTSQLAAGTTPELGQLFERWLSIIAGEILRESKEQNVLNIKDIAERIGIDDSSVLCLIQYLHRQGRIAVTEVRIAEGCGEDREICECLKE
ncbi:MAG: hypothetical protein ACP5DY_03205 [Thermovirgaceae bacterium]